MYSPPLKSTRLYQTTWSLFQAPLRQMIKRVDQHQASKTLLAKLAPLDVFCFEEISVAKIVLQNRSLT
jgi:hypothetical protein